MSCQSCFHCSLQISCSPFSPREGSVGSDETFTPPSVKEVSHEDNNNGVHTIHSEGPDFEESDIPSGSIPLPDDFKPDDPLPAIAEDGLQTVKRCIRYNYICFFFKRQDGIERKCFYKCNLWLLQNVGALTNSTLSPSRTL